MRAKALSILLTAVLVLVGSGCGSATGGPAGRERTAPPPATSPPGSPAVQPPPLPAAETIVALAGAAFDDPDHDCRPRLTPEPDTGGYVGCVVGGEYREQPADTGTIHVLFRYPPDDLTLFGWTPVTEWLGSSTRLFPGYPSSLAACHNWRKVDVPAGVPAVGCDVSSLRAPAVRVALATAEVLVFVGATAHVPEPDDQRGEAAFLHDLAVDTAQRMLAEL